MTNEPEVTSIVATLREVHAWLLANEEDAGFGPWCAGPRPSDAVGQAIELLQVHGGW